MAWRVVTRPHAPPRPWSFVIAGGMVAGSLDIVYACTFWALKASVPPTRIFQSVAAGVLGRASFDGGAATAVLGLALHFFIALTMAVVCFLVARRWPALWQRPWLYGALYGLVLYVVMNFIVVPLSAAGRGSTDPLWVILSIVVHVLFVGIPCAIAARYALSGKTLPS